MLSYHHSEEGLLAQPIFKGSESMTTFTEANSYIKILEDVNFIEKNEVVKVKLLEI